MMKLAALAWLLIVILAAGYLGARVQGGLSLRSDMLALLPQEEQDPELRRVNDTVVTTLSRRISLLVGAPSRGDAQQAADEVNSALRASGYLRVAAGGRQDLEQTTALYARHSGHFLSAEDRAALLRGEDEVIAARAQAYIFSPAVPITAEMLQADLFLLLPAFYSDLAVLAGRARLEEGRLVVHDAGITWYLLEFDLNGTPTDLGLQKHVAQLVDAAIAQAKQRNVKVQVLRRGAVFFAEAGARTGLNEASWLGGVALSLTSLLLIIVFRSIVPLMHNLFCAGIGIMFGVAGSLLVYGELHVAAVLFGGSLIGVIVDYSLHYSATSIGPAAATPVVRMERIQMALWMGLLTTLIGYAALAIAPLPGLRQIAVFSLLGLIGAFLCVLLWLPALDAGRKHYGRNRMYDVCVRCWPYIERTASSWARWPAVAALVLLSAYGLFSYSVNDDVRRLQSLDPDLLGQSRAIGMLLGEATEPQFLLVRGADDDTALQQQEVLRPTLEALRGAGGLDGYIMPAQFIPSAAHQTENRKLIGKLEAERGADLRQLIGIPANLLTGATTVLGWDEARRSGAFDFLDPLALWSGAHVVLLRGLRDPATLRSALISLPTVTLVDSVADTSRLLKQFRERLQKILLLSCFLLLPVLAWRYGWQRFPWVALPPILSIGVVLGVFALFGLQFTLFHVMAFILVLSIGVDYAIFVAESDAGERPVTLLGTVLATLTTQLSFGLLSISSVPAVSGFGLTMLVGLTSAFLLAPLAVLARRHSGQGR